MIQVEALLLRLAGGWIPVGGDGTWVNDRGRPALMRPLDLPLHVPVLPLYLLLLLYSKHPLPVVPCQRKEGGAGRPSTRPKFFDVFL